MNFKKVSLVVIVTLLFFSSANVGVAVGDEEALKKIETSASNEELIIKSTVFLNCGLGKGTGVIIDPAGYVLTNAHVVAIAPKDTQECYVQYSARVGSTAYPANISMGRVVASLDTHDLAIIKINEYELKNNASYIDLTKSVSSLQFGINAIFYGYPVRTTYVYPASNNHMPQREDAYILSKANGALIDDPVFRQAPGVLTFNFRSDHGASGSGVYANDGQYLGTLFGALKSEDESNHTVVVSRDVTKKFVLDLVNQGKMPGSVYNTSNLLIDTTMPSAQQTSEDISVKTAEEPLLIGQTAPVKVDKVPEVAQQIYLSGKDLNGYLKYCGHKKSVKDQVYAMNKYTNPLVGKLKLTKLEKYAINNFIVYANPLTATMKAVDRFNLLKQYKQQNQTLPKTASDWEILLKMIK